VYSESDMAHSVIITTPMPTLSDIRRRLSLSEADERFVDSLFVSNPVRKSENLAFKPIPSSSGPSSIKRSSAIVRKKTSRARNTA